MQIDIFDKFNLPMLRLSSVFMFLLILCGECFAQDQLLLTNGKIKKLKGTVVYYDYNDIFYQSLDQRQRLVEDSLERSERLRVFRNSEEYKRKQAAKKENQNKKKAKQNAKLEALHKDYQKRIPVKEQSLNPADFERWKQQREDEIRGLELKHKLYWELRNRSEDYEEEYQEAYFRSKYTRSRSRGNVFSILRADGTEEIVYNADTLGLLADGDFEVEYGVEEMRLYIKGRQDGRKHSFHDVYIGAAVGLASGLVFTYTLDMFYAPIPPAICIAVIAGLNNYKPNPKLELTKAMLDSDPYMDGYIKSAKGRKIFAFTVGAIGGLGVGIGTAVATSPLLR